ncbi:MAG: hypothetical protein IJU76_01200 [Desulfovibrionaceae bacterium]|nr:hypothetical protein [Desulfovibrionaceae bacterium]
MKPLNFAILKYLTTVPEACADDVLTALKSEYGSFKAFTKQNITTSLLTAEVNGLLEQNRFELDSSGELKLYFRAHDEGKAAINRYISD